MKDKNGEKIEIGYNVKCDGKYSFDPSEGTMFENENVRLYKHSDKELVNSSWNQKKGWIYCSEELTIIKDNNYKLMKLKE